jgi:hypothetical protein
MYGTYEVLHDERKRGDYSKGRVGILCPRGRDMIRMDNLDAMFQMILKNTGNFLFETDSLVFCVPCRFAVV